MPCHSFQAKQGVLQPSHCMDRSLFQAGFAKEPLIFHCSTSRELSHHHFLIPMKL